MPPVPPSDPNEDILELNDITADKQDVAEQDGIDADFEQELEDLFSEELDDGHGSDSEDEPILLDEVADGLDDIAGDVADQAADEENVLLLDDMVEEKDDAVVLEDVVEENGADEGEEDVLLLDQVAEEPAQAPSPNEAEKALGDMDLDALLDETEPAAPADEADLDALLEGVAEEDDAEPAPADEAAIDLDDLLDEGTGAGTQEKAPELDDLLGEVEEPAAADEILLEDVVEEPAAAESEVVEAEPVVEEAAAEEPVVEESVAVEAAVEEPEVESPILEEAALEDMVLEDVAADLSEPDQEISPEAEAVQPEEEGVFDSEALEQAMDVEIPADAEIVGNGESPAIEGLEDDQMDELAGLKPEDEAELEDMEHLLEGVDVSDIIDESVDEEEIDIPEMDISDIDFVEGPEIPYEVGHDVSEDVDMDALLEDVKPETVSVDDLQSRMAALEERFAALAGEPEVGDLEERIVAMEAKLEEVENIVRREVERLVPEEAARIIREEIAALARELEE